MTANPTYTTIAPTINCAIAALAAELEAAMEAFNILEDASIAAEQKMRDAEQKYSEAADRLAWTCIGEVAKSRRGIHEQLRELDIAVRSGETDIAARLVEVLTKGIEAMMPDDDSVIRVKNGADDAEGAR